MKEGRRGRRRRKKNISEDEWRAYRDDGVCSCANQNWVRLGGILWRPFQVQSVTQCEVVVSVIMATEGR